MTRSPFTLRQGFGIVVAIVLIAASFTVYQWDAERRWLAGFNVSMIPEAPNPPTAWDDVSRAVSTWGIGNLLRATVLVAIVLAVWAGWTRRQQFAGLFSGNPQPASPTRPVLIAVALAAVLVAGYTIGTWHNSRFQFINASDRALWKIDTRTGEAFLCVQVVRERRLVGSRCMLAEMPDWYEQRKLAGFGF